MLSVSYTSVCKLKRFHDTEVTEYLLNTGLLTMRVSNGENCTPKLRGKEVLTLGIQGHVVNSNTFKTMSIPVGICHTKSKTFNTLKVM